MTLTTDGTVSGVPETPGSYPFLVTVTDGLVPLSKPFTLFVRNPNPNVLTAFIVARSDGSVNSTTISENATAETTAPPRPCTARAAINIP